MEQLKAAENKQPVATQKQEVVMPAAVSMAASVPDIKPVDNMEPDLNSSTDFFSFKKKIVEPDNSVLTGQSGVTLQPAAMSVSGNQTVTSTAINQPFSLGDGALPNSQPMQTGISADLMTGTMMSSQQQLQQQQQMLMKQQQLKQQQMMKQLQRQQQQFQRQQQQQLQQLHQQLQQPEAQVTC